MALADFFSKDLLAISQILKKGSNDEFRDALNRNIIGIVYDDTIQSAEGKLAMDLAVRLVSRLYPKLSFIDHSTLGHRYPYEALCKSINTKIDLVDDEPTVTLVLGRSEYKPSGTQPVFYIGSDRWIAKFSSSAPVGSGNHQNPFGAGVAACIGCANIFRYVFKEFLDEVEFDTEVSLSLLSLSPTNLKNDSSPLDFNLDDFSLVGFGAIGNGVIWTLSHLPLLHGVLTIVEPQTVDPTNLQRYVLTEAKHVGKSKLCIAQEVLKGHRVLLNPIENDWSTYLSRTQNWHQKSILIAVDNVADRIAIQSMLPQEITNSYTETELIGIARHRHFGKEACVVCTYMPTVERKSFSQEVADNLGIPGLEIQVRHYLHYNLNADEQLLRAVAIANAIQYNEIEKYKGLPLSDFYSRIVCGGILLELRKGQPSAVTIEAPLAFQSALAGILLISEKVIEKGNLKNESLPNITHFYPLLPIKEGINPYSHSFEKDTSGRCICNDPDFINVYQKKWLPVPETILS